MATLAAVPQPLGRSRERFFLFTAFVMAAIVVAGFSLQLAAGRSTFGAPLLVHAHAIVFMGWVALYVLQNVFAASGNTALHRRLGWVGAGWIVAMLALGCMVTVAMARRGQVPFFFRPLHFLVFDPLSLAAFAGLTVAAIVLRRRTDWHRRLHYCGMAILLGPAFGRLLPLPFLVPWAYEATFAATLVFPAIGIARDLRRTGTVHPAWTWGVGTMLVSLLAIEAITFSPLGTAIYRQVTAGSPGAAVAPLAFPHRAAGPLITGRTTSM